MSSASCERACIDALACFDLDRKLVAFDSGLLGTKNDSDAGCLVDWRAGDALPGFNLLGESFFMEDTRLRPVLVFFCGVKRHDMLDVCLLPLISKAIDA